MLQLTLITDPQELGQADISAIRKSELKDRLTSLRKAFEKDAKIRETAAVKRYGTNDSLHDTFLKPLAQVDRWFPNILRKTSQTVLQLRFPDAEMSACPSPVDQ